jgi:hypothetical protein
VAVDRAALDAVLKLADKALQEFQGLLAITDLQGTVKKLRLLADLFERFPMLDNDISLLRSRIRGMMSSDPDQTPVTGISTRMAAMRGFTKPGGIERSLTPPPAGSRPVPPPIVTPAPMIALSEKKRDPR